MPAVPQVEDAFGFDDAVIRDDVTLVHLDQLAQQGFLTLGSVNLKAVALLHFAHFVDQVRALAKQLHQLTIDVVNFFADGIEAHSWRFV